LLYSLDDDDDDDDVVDDEYIAGRQKVGDGGTSDELAPATPIPIFNMHFTNPSAAHDGLPARGREVAGMLGPWDLPAGLAMHGLAHPA
jgi:hypothetical protein